MTRFNYEITTEEYKNETIIFKHNCAYELYRYHLCFTGNGDNNEQ